MELAYKIKKPQTIKDFMHENNVPHKLVLKDGKQLIVVNSEERTWNDSVKKGDTLRLTIPDEEIDPEVIKEDIPLDIVYEDEYLLVLNKAFGMPVMITKSHPTGTLTNALCHYYATHGINAKIHLVNRLDKETVGLMIVAKNRFVKFLLSEDLKVKIDRQYQAIIEGILDAKEGTIDLPIGKADEASTKREVLMDGEDAVTDFVVVKEFGLKSLIRVKLETGKTHQIRVHFAHFGHAVVGDPLYNPKYKAGERLMLQSDRLAFKHPITGKDLEFSLEMPADFKAYMARFGG
ncbi:MAG: RluA family pseudouridine synthase [Candidatus Izemoplasmatales bacterium]